MREENLDILRTTLQLKTAVDNHQFQLQYQPLVDMCDGSIYGAEALIRWNHPEMGLLGPDKFIALAEETGDIVAIGSWIMRQIGSDLCAIRRTLQRDLLLSFNVCSRQLDESFLFELSMLIHENQIDP